MESNNSPESNFLSMRDNIVIAIGLLGSCTYRSIYAVLPKESQQEFRLNALSNSYYGSRSSDLAHIFLTEAAGLSPYIEHETGRYKYKLSENGQELFEERMQRYQDQPDLEPEIDQIITKVAEVGLSSFRR